MPLINLGTRRSNQLVEQIVCLDALPLAPADVNVGLLGVFGRNFISQLGRTPRCQRHHVVRQVSKMLGLFFIARRSKSLHDDALRISLTRINHVIDSRGPAKLRSVRHTRTRRDPRLVAIGMPVERPVVKIAAEQAKFPEMVCNIFADVRNRAV